MDKEQEQEQEQIEWEESLREQRYKQQKETDDYYINESGDREQCECGGFINLKGHCPRCDY